MTFLAKKEVGAAGRFSAAELANLPRRGFLVDRQRRRGIPRVNAEMAAAMARGEPVVLFAEATTGDGNRMLPFPVFSPSEAMRQATAGGG